MPEPAPISGHVKREAVMVERNGHGAGLTLGQVERTVNGGRHGGVRRVLMKMPSVMAAAVGTVVGRARLTRF
jgi:hypothetical protein